MSMCRYENSKYYCKAVADPRHIAPPLSHEFLYKTEKVSFNLVRKGELMIREVYTKPNFRVLSSRRTPQQRMMQALKIQDLLRKNDYVQPCFHEFMRKETTEEIIAAMAHQFHPRMTEPETVIELSQLLTNPRLESLHHIEDYSLSKYLLLIEGSNFEKVDYLYELFNRRQIEYEVLIDIVDYNRKVEQSAHYKSTGSRDQKYQLLEPVQDCSNLAQVLEQIQRINKQNTNRDPLYSGVHFYFADYSTISPSDPRTRNIFTLEIHHLQTLQYFILMLTGVLGNGQLAILKLEGTFRHKTLQYIFLLKLIFNGKVSLVKTLGSNPFTPQSYLICEYYNRANGEKIHQYLIENFGMLKEFGESKLLVDRKKIFMECIQNDVTRFNDDLIMWGFQNNVQEFKRNANIEYYPSKSQVASKIPTRFCKPIEELVEKLKENTATAQDEGVSRKEGRKPQPVVEKQADYSMLAKIGNTSSLGAKQAKKDKKKEGNEEKEKSVPKDSQKRAVDQFLQKYQQKKEQEQREKLLKKKKKKKEHKHAFED